MSEIVVVEVRNNKIGTFVALVMLIAAILAGSAVVAFPGRAVAHPYDAPQIGDFVQGTFNCTGDTTPWGTRFVEFSGTWQGEYDAELEFVAFPNNEGYLFGGKNLRIGVDDKAYEGNSAPLKGTHGDKILRQNVVFYFEPARSDQEFGVYASWVRPPGAKQSDRALLARWKGSERFKCGIPFFG